MKTPNTYRELLCSYETHRDALAAFRANPNDPQAYFLPDHRIGFANARRELLAFVREQRAAGRVLCPISLTWCEPGDAPEDWANEADKEDREQCAAMERAADRANARTYGNEA